jgi:hypothetical protein
MPIGHLEPIEVYQVPVNDNLTLPFPSQTISDDINIIRTVIKRILGTSSYINTTSLENLQGLSQFKIDITNWKNLISLPSGLVNANSIDYSVVTNPNTYPAILNTNAAWVKLFSFSSFIDPTNKVLWSGISYTSSDIDSAISSTNTITTIQTNINNLLSQLNGLINNVNNLNINKISPSYFEIFGSSFSPDDPNNPSRLPILQRLYNLENAITGIANGGYITQNDLNNALNPINSSISLLTSQINNIPPNLSTTLSDINSRLSAIEDNIPIHLFSSKTDNNAAFIISQAFINLFINNSTQNITNFIYTVQSIKDKGYDYFIVPIDFQNFLNNITNIKSFLKTVKNSYLNSTRKNLPKPVILIVFNKYIDTSSFSLSNLMNALYNNLLNEKLETFCNLGFQIESSYLKVDGTTVVNFKDIKDYLIYIFGLLKETTFIFSYNLESLFGLLPQDIINKSILITSSRYAWKKTVSSTNIDFKNYYDIKFIDDLYELTPFCTPPNTNILCNLLPVTPNLYSDLSFLDLTLNTSSSPYVYNSPNNASIAYLKAKNNFFVDFIVDSPVETFEFFLNATVSPWTLNAINGPKKDFINRYPKISLYNKDTINNVLTSLEPSLHSTNDVGYGLYEVPSNSSAGNVFEFSNFLSFIFSEKSFNANISIDGKLNLLPTYTSLVNISFSSGTFTVTDASTPANSVTFTLSSSSLHFVLLNFSQNTTTNALDILIKIDNNLSNTLSIANFTGNFNPILFSVSNIDTQSLLFSKIYV